jgi:hypothetical protein
MAGKPKYPGKLTRLDARKIWMLIQNQKAPNRTQDGWLGAANDELFEAAGVRVKSGANIEWDAIEKPLEKVDLLLSFEALCGVKFTLIEAAKTAAFRERLYLYDAADGFGAEFGRLVRKNSKPPESTELDEEKELEGIKALAEAPDATVTPEFKKLD